MARSLTSEPEPTPQGRCGSATCENTAMWSREVEPVHVNEAWLDDPMPVCAYHRDALDRGEAIWALTYDDPPQQIYVVKAKLRRKIRNRAVADKLWRWRQQWLRDQSARQKLTGRHRLPKR